MTFVQIVSLAQAKPAPVDATPAEVLLGMCVLLVMMASLAMIVAWVVRIGQIGHALPAARRGVLRVPAPLTIASLVLSMLMLFLMLLLSGEDIPAAPIAGAPGAVAAEPADGNNIEAVADDPNPDGDAAALSDLPSDPTQETAPVEVVAPGGEVANADEASGTTEPDAIDPTALDPTAVAPADSKVMDGSPPKSAVSKMKPEQMRSAVIQTIIMDGILLAVFGAFVFIASNSGRLRLPEVAARPTSGMTSGGMSTFRTTSPWPDLVDENATRQAADVSMRDQRLESSLMSPLVLRSSSPYSVIPDSQGVTGVDGDVASAANVDEQFSFLTELWYAIEVFLAAYLPTAILRIIVVQLTKGLSGEDPGQHPFLEMLNAGVGIPVVVMILLTAVFCAPVVEELQYRVIVLGGLAQLGRPMLALWVSSFLFAFAHGFPDSLALVPLAFALGYTYLRRRSYVTVMLVHFLFNGFNMALALLAML